jgi:predicted nucleic acid-binding protein
MATKTKVSSKAYVDTSAFIAFLDSGDSYHPLFKQLFASPPQLMTSSLVIAEGHGWFLKRYDSYRALQFLNFIKDLTILNIIEVGDVLIKKSSAILRNFSDQSLTLTDACGLALMKMSRIHCCWSTDRHLSLTKVPLVIHQ